MAGIFNWLWSNALEVNLHNEILLKEQTNFSFLFHHRRLESKERMVVLKLSLFFRRKSIRKRS